MDLDDENINSAKVERIVKATSALVVSSTHADFEDINEQEAAPVKHFSAPSLYVESENKLESQEQNGRPTSAGRQRTPSQDAIVQKLDAAYKEVTYFRNIVTFDTEIKQSFPHRSDSETGRILLRLKNATSAAEQAPVETAQQVEENTFSTSVSEEQMEEARRRRERRQLEQEISLWKEDRPRIKMEEVVQDKVHQHYTRGVMEAGDGRFETALTSLNKALNLRPRDISCYVECGEAYLQLCDFKSAYLNYKKASTFQPNNQHIAEKLSFISYLEGQCLFDQGLYAEALECFVRAADLKPNAKGYHLRAITCLAALGRNQECLALLARRLDTEATGNPELFVLRARLHQQFGNVTLSYYDVRDALSLDSEQSQALDMMNSIRGKAENAKQQAFELTIQGKLNEALNKITSAIHIDPSKAQYHVLRGALYRRIHNFNAAIDDYLLAMDKSDHDESNAIYQDAQRQLLLTYNDFAVLCYQKGFCEEAVILLNKAIKGEKQEKGLYINRGDCFFKLNELGFALADYQQALDIDPVCWATKCRVSVVQNEFGIAAYQERLYQDAVEYFTLAVEQNNKVGQFYIHRARSLYMMEDADGARKDILVALHLNPDNEEMIPLLSRLFPGRTVSEVLQSKMADEIRKQLSSTITPHSRLPSVSRFSLSVSDKKRSVPSSPLRLNTRTSELSSAEPAVPDARHLMSDREIMRAKKKIVGDLKNILSCPVNLESTQAKILSPISPQSSTSDDTPNKFYKWKKFDENAKFN